MLNRHRKLRMEQMESREMMAGDVAGYVSNNTLYLYESYGQAGRDNSVVISQLAPGTVRVRGGVTADGTVSKINGAAYTDFQVTGGLNIAFAGGNDSVILGPSLATGGSGNSGFILGAPSFHNVTLNMGGPTTTTTRSLTSTVTLTPADKDYVSINRAAIPGWLTINTGVGDDRVYVRETSVGHSDLRTGAPNTGGITVNTGLGNDTIYFDGLASAHDINIDAGAGNDRVDVLNGAVIDNFMAQLGDGDDVMSINNLKTRLQPGTAKTQISGAGGVDRLTISGSPFRNLEMTGWEYFNGNPIFAPLVNPLSSGVAAKL
jgi:hypothetical protein